MADVTRYDDLAEFHAATVDFFGTDPVFHTTPIAALERRLRHPDPDDQPALMLTVVQDDVLVAAALRTPPWYLTLSGVPPQWADTLAEALAGEVELPGVNGPRESVEAFTAAWTARTGVTAKEDAAMRLFRLGELEPPTDVTGEARLATEDDLDLLVRWYLEFVGEATVHEPEEDLANKVVRVGMAAGSGNVLWTVDGEPVAWACASKPVAGMSRIGPVFTPVAHRRHGYGAAVTAASSRWALEAGAEHVVLYTDLANPVSNSIYQRIGYRAVVDSAEFAFVPAG
ncbi:GNAT family N-acetyltransferase [Actinosynnema sp. NPDC020468]|uniref:GNAT family N-acetyltransferase n=1 Tax=Actinosynnema sp. NPDC020468 TaxID=3154488 RepID=UPI00340F1DD3